VPKPFPSEFRRDVTASDGSPPSSTGRSPTPQPRPDHPIRRVNRHGGSPRGPWRSPPRTLDDLSEAAVVVRLMTRDAEVMAAVESFERQAVETARTASTRS
jgi:hypothetical protein